MLVRRLDEGNDMSFGRGLADFAQDAEAVAQNVYTRLQLLQGEWFLDTGAGVPWLQEIMVKPADLRLTESLLKQTILETDGVSAIAAFSLTFDHENRSLAVAATITTIYGTTESIQVRK